MKTLCAWCGSTISIHCHCGAPLAVTSYIGSTFDQGSMVCFNGESVLTYSRRAIEDMPVSHGICPKCAALPEETRDALLIERRKHQSGLPNAGERDRLVADNNRARTHEEQTRAADHAAIHNTAHQKRGPKGVPRSATPPAAGEKENP